MVSLMRLESQITSESLERQRYAAEKPLPCTVSDYTQLFNALSETLHNHVRHVAAEKNEMTEEAQRIITTIRQMDVSINGPKDHQYEAEDDLRVTIPLIPCLLTLKEKHLQISRIHKERFEQVKSELLPKALYMGMHALTVYRARTGSRVLFISS